MTIIIDDNMMTEKRKEASQVNTPQIPNSNGLTTITTINIRTLGPKHDIKLGQIVAKANKLRYKITLMQEVRRPGSGMLEIDGYKLYYSGQKKRCEQGVAIMVTSDVKVEDVQFVSPRIISMQAIVDNLRLNIVSVYSPTNEAKDSQKDLFWRELKNHITTLKKSYKIIIGGDFNSTIGSATTGNYRCVGSFHLEKYTNSDDNGERLLNFAEANWLKIENTRHRVRQIHLCTWRSNVGKNVWKRLDYFLTCGFISKMVTNIRARRGNMDGIFDTDHAALEMKLRIPKSKAAIKRFLPRKHTRARINLTCLMDDPDKLKEYVETLNEQLGDVEDANNVDDICDYIVEAVQHTTTVVCPQITHAPINKPWEDDALKELSIRVRQSAAGTVERKQLQGKLRAKRKALMDEYYGRKSDEINTLHEEKKVSQEFKAARKMASGMHNNGVIGCSKAALSEHFTKHFQDRGDIPIPTDLVNAEELDFVKEGLEAQDNINETAPGPKEIGETIRMMKNGRCEGAGDRLKNEQIKYGADAVKLVQWLVLLFAMIWQCVQVPAVWCVSKITALYKKGAHCDPANYRPLSVTSTLSRLLPMLICKRLEVAYNKLLDWSQCGFRRNSSCADAVHILHECITKYNEQIYILYVDLTAAYDKLPRKLLFYLLYKRFKCHKLIDLIKAIYTGTTATIKGHNTKINIQEGCRQGGIESPLLFNVYLDFVARIIDSRLTNQLGIAYGIHFEYCIPGECTNRTQRTTCHANGHTWIKKILYADDAAFLFSTKSAIQVAIYIINDTLVEYGLVLSVKKTETQVVNSTDYEEENLIELNGTKIKNSKVFKYLGVNIDPNNDTAMTAQRIAAAWGKYSELKRVLTDHRIKMGIRRNFLQAYCRSRLTYTAHTWDISEKNLASLEVVWRKMLRSMIKGGHKRRNSPPTRNKKESLRAYNQRISKQEWDYAYIYNNDDIYRITGAGRLDVFIRKQTMRWLGHVVRMENFMPQKQILFAKNQRKYSHDRWLKLEKWTGLDRGQIRTIMMKKKEFHSWLDVWARPATTNG